MALPETPFEKRAKFEVIDGGLMEQPAQKYQNSEIKKASSIYEGSLKLLARDLEEFLTHQA